MSDDAGGAAAEPDSTAATLEAAERWFVHHGLPYFVDSERAAVREGLRPRRLIPAMAGSALVAVGVGVLLGWLTDDVSLGIGTALTFAGIGAGLYAATTLRMTAMARWAVTRTFKSLGLLFPLVTRALPLLLVFVMFLFINAEVWEVGAALDGGVLWVTVLLFAGLAVAFLLARLPEELDAVDDEVDSQRLVVLTRGTPLNQAAERLVDKGESGIGLAEDSTVRGFQKANLIVVLLVAQIVQVFLLSLSVLAFFIVFGTVAMKSSVVEGWIGDQQLNPWGVGYLSAELVQVSVFLAAFSGMYFTVAAITDEVYRKQFFTSITRELERAVGARTVYHYLKSQPTS
ncbi:MAG TPA: hypothetical protein VLB29_16090 [Nocardioidaceae bacterium]|nr:hypothetical protein [Nocardioidaceae bacterium]